MAESSRPSQHFGLKCAFPDDNIFGCTTSPLIRCVQPGPREGPGSLRTQHHGYHFLSCLTHHQPSQTHHQSMMALAYVTGDEPFPSKVISCSSGVIASNDFMFFPSPSPSYLIGLARPPPAPNWCDVCIPLMAQVTSLDRPPPAPSWYSRPPSVLNWWVVDPFSPFWDQWCYSLLCSAFIHHVLHREIDVPCFDPMKSPIACNPVKHEQFFLCNLSLGELTRADLSHPIYVKIQHLFLRQLDLSCFNPTKFPSAGSTSETSYRIQKGDVFRLMA